jgi:hypothetical protein
MGSKQKSLGEMVRAIKLASTIGEYPPEFRGKVGTMLAWDYEDVSGPRKKVLRFFLLLLVNLASDK